MYIFPTNDRPGIGVARGRWRPEIDLGSVPRFRRTMEGLPPCAWIWLHAVHTVHATSFTSKKPLSCNSQVSLNLSASS